MTDKVIQEVRFIETDEGYRIEINGDKEKLRRIGFSPERMFRRGMGCGPGMRSKHEHGGFGHHRHGHGHHRRHMHGHFGPGFAPPWMWQWAEEVDEDDEQDVPNHKVNV